MHRLKMSQSGSWLLRPEDLAVWPEPSWPGTRCNELRALVHPGLCPGRGNKGPLCEDMGGAAVPEDTYKLFSVPKVGRMSPRLGGGEQLCL